jgi:hypothetical protein
MSGKDFFIVAAGIPALIMVLVYAAAWLITPRFSLDQDPVMYAIYAAGIWYGLCMLVVITTAR